MAAPTRSRGLRALSRGLRALPLAAALAGWTSCATPPPATPDAAPAPSPAPDDPRLAVATGRDLPAMRAEALDALEALFALRGLRDVEVSVTLLPRPELLDLARDLAHPSLRAFTEAETTTAPDGRVKLRLYRVYMLAGQTRLATAAALAHELFHVHTVEQGGGIGAREAWREGAAMHVHQRVLAYWGRDDLAAQLLESPDPAYGEGLRRFRRLVRERGEAEALRLAATTLDFPRGY